MADTQDFAAFGVGTAGAIYGGWEYWRNKGIVTDWNKVVSDAQLLQEDIDAYISLVNQIVAKFDTAFAGGPVDNYDISLEMAELSELEKKIFLEFILVTRDLDNTRNDIDDRMGFWSFIESNLPPSLKTLKFLTLGGLSLYFVGKVLLPAGYGCYRFFKKIQDDLNNRNKPGGTSGSCPKCNSTISGATAEDWQINSVRHFQTVHDFNPTAYVSMVPGVRSSLVTLPDWAQTQLAVESGVSVLSVPTMNGFNYRQVCGLLGSALLLGLVTGGLGFGLESSLSGMISGLAGALI